MNKLSIPNSLGPQKIRGLARRNLGGGKKRHAGAAMLYLLGATGVARAQQVLAPLPNFAVPYPTLRLGFGEETQASIVPGSISLFQWGPVSVRPHADYQFSYGTGIQSAPGDPQASIVQTFSPGVLLSLGSAWTLDYTPTFTYYSSSQLQDNVGQNLILNGRVSYEDWQFGLSQSYSEFSAPLVETGAQTESTSYLTALTGSYRFNSSLSMDLAVNQSLSFYGQGAVNQTPANQQALQSTREWSTLDYLNYQLFTRITFGIGAGVTYDNVSSGPNFLTEVLQARINWVLTPKSTFNLHAGLQDQQYFGGGQPSLFSPVFGANLTYSAAAYTTITLDAERSVSPSALQSQVSTTTAVTLGVSQRFFKRYTLSVDGGYTTSSYGTTVQGVSVNREDDYYSLNTRLSWMFWKRASASLFYQYSVNNSSQSVFAFSSSQSGFELGYRF